MDQNPATASLLRHASRIADSQFTYYEVESDDEWSQGLAATRDMINDSYMAGTVDFQLEPDGK